MLKRLRKEDYFFCAFLLCGLAFHLTLIWTPHRLYDETFYPTVPYRLIMGDSLVQHEWHLTQFSSVFLYLPVRLWLLIKGSTEGIYLYLRFLYIFVHTCVTVSIYKFFRNYGIWSAVAAIIFYMMIPFKTYALSYTSMLVIFYLLFVLSLFSIYKNHSLKSYLSAGFCFGCCCVNNPLFCIIFPLYLILCLLWTKNGILIDLLSRNYLASRILKKNPQKAKKKSFTAYQAETLRKKDILSEAFSSYNCFFSKQAVIHTICGICIIAVISVVFFYSTGGTISSIFRNMENLMQSSEYFTTSKGVWIQKTFDFKNAINSISINLPFLLPAFFLILFIDKKRKVNSHRIFYLLGALALSVLFFFGMITAEENTSFFYSLPFAVFSLVCYILTNKKQTDLFFCIWCPSVAAALFCCIISNTLFFSSSAICAIANIPGVFFVCQLFKEIISEYRNENTPKHTSKAIVPINRAIIIIAILFQIFSSCYIAQDYLRLEKDSTTKATAGPLKGMYYNEEAYELYASALKSLDYLKTCSDEDDPFLLIGNLNWVYMYAERPFATYTAYYLGFDKKEILMNFYKENPDKIPKYICALTVRTPEYIRYAYELLEQERETIDALFEYTEEKLDNAILLTVTDYKFD